MKSSAEKAACFILALLFVIAFVMAEEDDAAFKGQVTRYDTGQGAGYAIVYIQAGAVNDDWVCNAQGWYATPRCYDSEITYCLHAEWEKGPDTTWYSDYKYVQPRPTWNDVYFVVHPGDPEQ